MPPYNFSHKLLKHVNKPQLQSTDTRICFIADAFEPVLKEKIDVNGFLTDLYAWLANDVCGNKSAVEACATLLFNAIHKNWDLLKGHDSTDLVASFLVEALRCYNFAKHDSNAIIAFIKLFGDLGVKIDLDQNCVKCATFGDLTYSKGVVKMSM